MNPARYEELLGRLLEQELSEAEARELACGMEENAALPEDVRRHLVLWELWSQVQAPERSAEAFVKACTTRLRASREDAQVFFDGVRMRIGAGERVGEPLSDETNGAGAGYESASPLGAIVDGIARMRSAVRQRMGLAWVVSLGLTGLIALLWLALPRSAQALTTIKGEAVCTSCVLHEGHEHLPAVRVVGGHSTNIYYLSANQITAGLQPYFCSGPNPIVAEGKTGRQKGRLSFDVVAVDIAGAKRVQPSMAEPSLSALKGASRDPQPEVTKHLRRLIQDALEGRMQAGDYTPEFWQEIAPRQKEVQDSLIRTGAPLSMTLIERQDNGGQRSYRYLLDFRDARVIELFVLDAQGKVVLIKPEREELKAKAK